MIACKYSASKKIWKCTSWPNMVYIVDVCKTQVWNLKVPSMAEQVENTHWLFNPEKYLPMQCLVCIFTKDLDAWIGTQEGVRLLGTAP